MGPSGIPETETCAYGETFCYVCDASCALEELTGRWCGDGLRQADDGELCDSDTRPCNELSTEFSAGTATCSECQRWDTSTCVVDIEDPNKMVLVEGGLFYQGCNDVVDADCYDDREYPYHQTQVENFYIDTYEVTVAQYRNCVNAGVCGDDGVDYDSQSCNYGQTDRENHPMNCVSWGQAQTYCNWALKSLPTEAEWEKAARGPDGQKYPWGSADVDCNYVIMDSSRLELPDDVKLKWLC